jgi:hypothetical protein
MPQLTTVGIKLKMLRPLNAACCVPRLEIFGFVLETELLEDDGNFLHRIAVQLFTIET